MYFSALFPAYSVEAFVQFSTREGCENIDCSALKRFTIRLCRNINTNFPSVVSVCVAFVRLNLQLCFYLRVCVYSVVAAPEGKLFVYYIFIGCWLLRTRALFQLMRCGLCSQFSANCFWSSSAQYIVGLDVFFAAVFSSLLVEQGLQTADDEKVYTDANIFRSVNRVFGLRQSINIMDTLMANMCLFGLFAGLRAQGHTLCCKELCFKTKRNGPCGVLLHTSIHMRLRS